MVLQFAFRDAEFAILQLNFALEALNCKRLMLTRQRDMRQGAVAPIEIGGCCGGTQEIGRLPATGTSFITERNRPGRPTILHQGRELGHGDVIELSLGLERRLILLAAKRHLALVYTAEQTRVYVRD